MGLRQVLERVVTDSPLVDALQPYGARVLVRPMGMASTMRSGIIVVAEQDKFSQARGVVVAVGQGAPNQDGTLRPINLAVGDVVYFAQVASAPLFIDGHERVVINEDRVQAVIRQAKIVQHAEEEYGMGDHLEGEPCHRCANRG